MRKGMSVGTRRDPLDVRYYQEFAVLKVQMILG
jgi:hypothetical protein